MAATSRPGAAGPEVATATPTTSGCPDDPAAGAAGHSRSEASLQGSSNGEAASRRRSSGRCQSPWRPGRLAAAQASKRIAPGSGHSSAAVVLE